ncbi:hypothetical protein BDY17DRAFT_132036 [Neohortaea acidophila]|uniref:Uncharacterized protein n=1 Tax=Neohortaea acidophila TaxID=245834 RepID=A0A6A6PXW9_9PEZI|nr:uncharacterized protein BDY17DRAFT_132036 [Neohortaea acidophila]KAF2484601.1 hypothetical protein BDY17DRAFT_132036 [Neohortaea acidophila]
MAEPSTTSKSSTTATQSRELPPSAAVRHRLPQSQRNDSHGSQSPRPTLDRRRSSMLSYSSIEDLSHALTNDIINPSMSRPRTARDDDEVTHWHSTPLAFAILPAIAGLLFKNGSHFITDILLIVLAAIFMNWSIRLPWDWYYSAQSQRRDVDPDDYDAPLEDDNDEAAVESASSAGTSPNRSARLGAILETEAEAISVQQQQREGAAAELRRQEVTALIATFIFPAAAAYLLHIIRAQLTSPSSTGLVSDYNLTIFLLAAEIRPCRQLIRLATNRTLHLQRTVTSLHDPFTAASTAALEEEQTAITTLTARIAELEAKITNPSALIPQNGTIAQKQDVSELSTELRKRYEPRLDGLERAVRRYEKRSTTLAMLTEQRLNSLETRLQDALSLAAAAATQSRHRGPFAALLDTVALVLLWPVQVACSLAVSPLRVLDELYVKLKVLLFGSSAARGGRSSSTKTKSAREDVKAKTVTRKNVR